MAAALGEWPRTPSGLLSTEDDVFDPMAMRFPSLAPLRDLRLTLNRPRQLRTPVGTDANTRCALKPYRAKTGRNCPPASEFIFGPSTWLRSLIKPEPGRAIAYVDCSSAEFGIAAALSGDVRMKAAYESGDIYAAFAIEAGAAPKGATQATHPEVRALYKELCLPPSTTRPLSASPGHSGSQSGGHKNCSISTGAFTPDIGNGVSGGHSRRCSTGRSTRSSTGPCMFIRERNPEPSLIPRCRQTGARCCTGLVASRPREESRYTRPSMMPFWSVAVRRTSRM